MIYKRELKINKTEADVINHYLTDVPEDWQDCLGEDDTISYSVNFGNGMEMDIKCCGVQYEEGCSNLAWTEAVLFENGSEVCFTEPSDEYIGEWELEHKGNKYIVNVTVE